MCSIMDYEIQRQRVNANLESAIADNYFSYKRGDPFASAQYIYPNQESDANRIMALFRQGKQVISVQKRTKIGADGLMTYLCCQMTSCEDGLIIDVDNVFILTGMSNKLWESSMIDKSPSFLKKQIFHHGKLNKINFNKEGPKLIVIDEIDVGDKKKQKLHKLLESANLLDLTYLQENNIYMVFISATIIKELACVEKWGPIHANIIMQVPPEYVSIKYLYDKGMVKEYFKISSVPFAINWIEEDILKHFGDDYRVHLISCDAKSSQNIVNACMLYEEVEALYHNSDDRLEQDTLNQYFTGKRTKHTIIMVKKFYSRANLIPNEWKMNIGSIMDRFTNKPDYNVLNQGLVRRMTGFWKKIIEDGHKMGIYRTSIASVLEYEKAYDAPTGDHNYVASGYRIKDGVPVVKGIALDEDCVSGIDKPDEPIDKLIDEAPVPEQVPIFIELNPMQISQITKIGNSWDYNTITPFLPSELVIELSKMEQAYIVNPRSEINISSKLVPLRNAVHNKRRMIVYSQFRDNEREYLSDKDWYAILIDTTDKPGLFIVRVYNKSYLDML